MKMNLRGLMVGICIASVGIISACSDRSDVPNELETWLKDIEEIDASLAASGTTAIEDPSGVRMVITTLGTGLPAQRNNGVDVTYVGRRFSDKVIFDQGNIRQNLTNLIDGWEVALSILPVGSEATIYIPSILGYGPGGQGSSIPPNTILEFDILFNEVVQTTGEIEQIKEDTAVIDQYLLNKGIAALEDPSGIRYVITTPGAGPTATWYDKLELKYAIKLLTNDAVTVITLERSPTEQFYSRPVDYIQGMKAGLQKMSEGSKATFYIPSTYAFGPEGGSDGSGATIPGDANLIIEAELINIQ